MDLFATESMEWTHLVGGAEFDYPIDYWYTVLSARSDGHIDLVFRWEPNAYCHFHRHLVETTSTILQGELHVVDMENGQEVGRRTRSVGDYAHKPAGDVHMEYAGADGAMVVYNLYAPDGRLFDMLDREGKVLMPISTEDITSGRLGA